MIHIIYIPGLGDRYDFIRKAGLRLWRRKDVIVTHVPMRWLDPGETFEAKLGRLEQAIDLHPDAQTVLVGESAGGAMVISALRKLGNRVSDTVTVCGMNHGAENVNPKLYRKNSAFKDTMTSADSVVTTLGDAEKKKLYIIYSSRDFTVFPKNTLIKGVKSHNLKILGHMPSILAVLFWRYSKIFDEVLSDTKF